MYTGLEHYLAVRDGVRPPHYIEIGADALNQKIALADRMLDACDLCPHHCRVNRNQGETGFCGVAAKTAVHWEGVLCGEEVELVPSHEVFLSGCTMRCAFCYSHEHIVRPMSGLPMASTELAACVRQRHREGATNLNLVGGEPTVHIPNILRTLHELRTNPADDHRTTPIIWNSNMYMTPAAMELLSGVVDLYLGDIHFGNEKCARDLGRIPEYLPSVTAALKTAAQSGASVIIRHLVMPGHLECCARPAMRWAKAELPLVPFHLMLQYIPDYRAENDPILGRVLTENEKQAARQIAVEEGVFLYRESERRSVHFAELNDTGAKSTSELPVDILIHEDGRVSFTRLSPQLIPVAESLSPGRNIRLSRREQRTEEVEK